MSENTSAYFMIGLDAIMIVYTLWIVSIGKSSKSLLEIGLALFAWLGLLDILIVASTLSLFLLPRITPHHSMMYAVFLPAPLWLWFHLVSIWKLMNEERMVRKEALA